jgi:hypothetical protein
MERMASVLCRPCYMNAYGYWADEMHDVLCTYSMFLEQFGVYLKQTGHVR